METAGPPGGKSALIAEITLCTKWTLKRYIKEHYAPTELVGLRQGFLQTFYSYGVTKSQRDPTSVEDNRKSFT